MATDAELTRYRRIAFQTAWGVLHHIADTEDVASETILRVFLEPHELRCPVYLPRYVKVTAYNLAIDFIRRRNRRDRKETGIGDWDVLENAEHHRLAFTDDWDLPDMALLRRELSEVVRDAVHHLPAHYREIVHLRLLEGLDTYESAERMGCSVGTTKSRLSRALKFLRPRLEEYVCAA